MNKYNLVAENPESTVVAEYAPQYGGEERYQSEAELEKSFIKQLCSGGYDYLPITTENELIVNLRTQLEKLNDIQFSDKEWTEFFTKVIANPNSNIEDKTTIIQEDYIQLLTRDDGSTKNIYLIKKDNIHDNYLQVINQYATDKGVRSNRYDVTVLVNGLPLVHIELKRRGVDIKEAFNQINRYNRESFWAGCGLFEYVQLFVISNGTYTKYYSNTTRLAHIKEQKGQGSKKGKKTSHSYEFTSWWADAKNKPITDLTDFTKTFFTKHSLLNIITKYCVFTVDKILLVMRPYQIVATERILSRINISQNYKTYGKIDGGGFVWHTTGSGKTLTSFKTAQLSSKLSYIKKVLFVVDRKDLDYQTMKEYDKFEKGAANSNTSTAKLKQQLEDPNCKIIITTIQKLSVFIKKNQGHNIFSDRFVIIFDECHRSQFGDMHIAITKYFKNYNIFGFTGTPISSKNSVSGGNPKLKTTAQAFGDKLHTYTIVNAITDQNVLPFRIDYISTMRKEEQIDDKAVYNIDREKALASPKRISNITQYILEHFNHKTKRNDKAYSFNKVTNISEVASTKQRDKIEEIKQTVRMSGFNSIFAVASIDFAKLYYSEFQRQMAELPEAKRLKIAIIYSYGANEDIDETNGLMEEENSESTSGLDASSADFLENAIKNDYNKMFGTSYDTSSEKFQNYYKDVSLRLKNRELDLLIVVNMFLTGFDATTLNTLWVDKNLRMHGLLQAYSRTNRILNSIKTFGNIVCFRNLEQATKDSIALFGNEDAAGVVLLKSYDEYMTGYTDSKGNDVRGYVELVEELMAKFPVGEIIASEEAQKEFIRLYGAILKLRNILMTFDKFENDDTLTERDVQDFHSVYISLYQKYRQDKKVDSENINDDIVFEMELIKQVDINIDYILALIKQYKDSHLKDKEIVVTISKAIDSSVDLRNKKELIEQFIDSITPSSEVDEEWESYIKEQRETELNNIITEEKLKSEETYKFINNAFRDGYIQSSGTDISKILPPVSRFSGGGVDRVKKKETVVEKLKAFFDKFWSLSSGRM